MLDWLWIKDICLNSVLPLLILSHIFFMHVSEDNCSHPIKFEVLNKWGNDLKVFCQMSDDRSLHKKDMIFLSLSLLNMCWEHTYRTLSERYKYYKWLMNKKTKDKDKNMCFREWEILYLKIYRVLDSRRNWTRGKELDDYFNILSNDNNNNFPMEVLVVKIEINVTIYLSIPDAKALNSIQYLNSIVIFWAFCQRTQELSELKR